MQTTTLKEYETEFSLVLVSFSDSQEYLTPVYFIAPKRKKYIYCVNISPTKVILCNEQVSDYHQ